MSENLPVLLEDGPRAGDRFPWVKLKFVTGGPVEDLLDRLDNTRFSLIVIEQPPLPADRLELTGLLRTHVVPAPREYSKSFFLSAAPRWL